MIQGHQNQLVAIVGGSGAGKSWLAHRLGLLLGEQAAHISLDDFYLDHSHLTPAERGRVNFDVLTAIDWRRVESVLVHCQDSRHEVSVPRYDFSTHARLVDRAGWKPRPIVLVDGLWLLAHAPIRHLFSFSLFLDCPESLRLERRLARDSTERGADADEVRRRFETVVAPMHRLHVEPQRSLADFVLAQPYQEKQLLELADRFWRLLQAGTVLPEWMRASFRAEMLALVGAGHADGSRTAAFQT